MDVIELQRLHEYRADMQQWLDDLRRPAAARVLGPTRRCRLAFDSGPSSKSAASNSLLVTELFFESNHDEDLVLDLPEDEPADTERTIGAPMHPASWYLAQLRLLLTDAKVAIVAFVSEHVWTQLEPSVSPATRFAYRRRIVVADLERLPALRLRGGRAWAHHQALLGLRQHDHVRPTAIMAWAAKVKVVALASSFALPRPRARIAFVDAGIIDGNRQPETEMAKLGEVVTQLAGDDRVAFASVFANARLGIWPSGAWFGGSGSAIQQFADHLAALAIRLEGTGLRAHLEERSWACVLQLEHRLGAFARLHQDPRLAKVDLEIAEIRRKIHAIRSGPKEALPHDATAQLAILNSKLRDKQVKRNTDIRRAVRDMLSGRLTPDYQYGIAAEHSDFRTGPVHEPFDAHLRQAERPLASQLDPLRALDPGRRGVSERAGRVAEKAIAAASKLSRLLTPGKDTQSRRPT